MNWSFCELPAFYVLVSQSYEIILWVACILCPGVTILWDHSVSCLHSMSWCHNPMRSFCEMPAFYVLVSQSYEIILWVACILCPGVTILWDHSVSCLHSMSWCHNPMRSFCELPAFYVLVSQSYEIILWDACILCPGVTILWDHSVSCLHSMSWCHNPMRSFCELPAFYVLVSQSYEIILWDACILCPGVTILWDHSVSCLHSMSWCHNPMRSFCEMPAFYVLVSQSYEIILWVACILCPGVTILWDHSVRCLHSMSWCHNPMRSFCELPAFYVLVSQSYEIILWVACILCPGVTILWDHSVSCLHSMSWCHNPMRSFCEMPAFYVLVSQSYEIILWVACILCPGVTILWDHSVRCLHSMSWCHNPMRSFCEMPAFYVLVSQSYEIILWDACILCPGVTILWDHSVSCLHSMSWCHNPMRSFCELPAFYVLVSQSYEIILWVACILCPGVTILWDHSVRCLHSMSWCHNPMRSFCEMPAFYVLVSQSYEIILWDACILCPGVTILWDHSVSCLHSMSWCHNPMRSFCEMPAFYVLVSQSYEIILWDACILCPGVTILWDHSVSCLHSMSWCHNPMRSFCELPAFYVLVSQSYEIILWDACILCPGVTILWDHSVRCLHSMSWCCNPMRSFCELPAFYVLVSQSYEIILWDACILCPGVTILWDHSVRCLHSMSWCHNPMRSFCELFAFHVLVLPTYLVILWYVYSLMSWYCSPMKSFCELCAFCVLSLSWHATEKQPQALVDTCQLSTASNKALELEANARQARQWDVWISAYLWNILCMQQRV